jgi:hypothetical protein
MQLTLLSTFARPAAVAGPAPVRGPAAPSREALAMSQLDRIAAQNLRGPVHGLGGAGMLLALVGGLVVLGSASMWRGSAGEAQHEPRKVEQAESRSAPAAMPSATPGPVPAATAAADAKTPSVVDVPEPALPALATVDPAPTVVAATEPAADDAARKARAKQVAEARRKSAQLAQERALAEETQRLQVAQQRETERVQQQQQLDEQARQRAAAEQARAQSFQLALDTRRSVGDSCAAGSLLSRQFCRARECGKAEHQGDAVCVNMREDELAQQRASINR